MMKGGISMKCNKCGDEWESPPGKSLKFCPNCAAPMQKTTLDSSSDNVIKAIIRQRDEGERILLDPRLSSLVADKLQNKAPQLLKRLQLAINIEKVPEKLHALKSNDEQDRTFKIIAIATALIDDYRMEEEMAYEIVNYFTDAFGYNLVMAPNTNLQYQSVPVQQTSTQTRSAPARQTSSNKNVSQIANVGDIIQFGGYDWRVLEVDRQNGKKLILSDKIIEKRWYHHSLVNTTWADCELHSYLNGEFYNKFNDADKNQIIRTPITTNNNPWWTSIPGGKDTSDWIFLLSLEEIVGYFGDSSSKLKNKGSQTYWISDENNSKRIAEYGSEGAWWWWLRSPGSSSSSAAGVIPDGYVRVTGYYVSGSGVGGGVRPALWLNL
jgi:hypothetical protein